MHLAPGTQLGHYEITEPIGAGGMGEVYRARDTKLGRDVAIKVLPEEFAQHRERLDRFEREAKLLAALNHANVATLFGLEEAAGRQFLVMELVEGETLAERIARGPIPLDEAIALFVQVADGLEAAHEKGIVHRDLKPANAKITPEGKIKILDFGLAKAFAPDEDVSAGTSQSPTLTKGTALGAIMGTASYMSPEQARGKVVDKRTDIWAFGCCLYEALTGKKAFDGETVSDILVDVLKSEPQDESLPPSVRRLVRRCLSKDPAKRYHDIADVRLELEEALTEPVALEGDATPGRRLALVSLIGAGLLGAIVAGLGVWTSQLSTGPLLDPMHVAITLPPDHVIGVTILSGALESSNPIALSRDGARLVYADRHEGRTELYLRSLDEREATVLPGTEGAEAPFFSPDGEWVGFFAQEKLRKVSLPGGGSPFDICDAPLSQYAASWGTDDTIVFASTTTSGLARVPAGGGPVETLTVPDITQGEFSHLLPQVLPGGENILFTIATTAGSSIGVLRGETGEPQVLLRRAAGARYVPTGHIVYANAGGVWGVTFDEARLEVTGSPVPLVAGVLSSIWVGVNQAAFAISDTGLLAYVPRGTGGKQSPVWVDREGKASLLTEDRGRFVHPRLSPDGKRLAIAKISDVGQSDIWIYDTERGTRTRLTTEGRNYDSAWKPDGSRVFFNSTRSGQGLYSRTPDGSGEAEPLLVRRDGQNYLNLGSWSPDGTTLAFIESDPIATGFDIWIVSEDGDGTATPLIATTFNESAPEFSPDGRFLAYVSDESGRNEVYVVEYPSLEKKTVVSLGGGVEPNWSRSGSELFYRLGDQMLVVAVETSPAFSAGKPRVLFEERYSLNPVASAAYDVSPDGQKFLMISGDESSQPTHINIVLNWFEDLKRLVPKTN